MLTEITEIQNQALQEISQCEKSEQILEIEKKYIGKQGALADILKNIKNLDVEAKKTIGQKANISKHEIQNALLNKKQELEQALKRLP